MASQPEKGRNTPAAPRGRPLSDRTRMIARVNANGPFQWRPIIAEDGAE